MIRVDADRIGYRWQIKLTLIKKISLTPSLSILTISFTAIDDSTRLKNIRIYPNKKAESTIHCLGEILNTFPFPIQRIQTDGGTEFFNYDFQYELHAILSNLDL